MGIPQARDQLEEICQKIDAGEMYEWDEVTRSIRHVIETEMWRRPPAKPRAPATNRPVTPEIRTAVLELVKRDPTTSVQSIGDAVGINSGRVSEILHGVR